MTTKDILARDWNSLRGKLKDRWHSLTDQDVENINGSCSVLVSMLQERYSFNKQVAESEVNEFLNEFSMTKEPMKG